MEYPRLIEPNVKNYLFSTLQQCHDRKEVFYAWIFNAILLVIIILVVGSVLYYCRKRKLTPYEQSEKMRKDQEYVLSKIRQYQTVKKQSPITDLQMI